MRERAAEEELEWMRLARRRKTCGTSVEHYVAALAVRRLQLGLLLWLVSSYGDDGDVGGVDEDGDNDQPAGGAVMRRVRRGERKTRVT